MVYLSLYRRQRPLTFSGMTGQEHVARTLKHALSRGQLAHAYLFCGPRGTGKTTAAKIMARAVNCRNYPVPEPCGECVSCRNILTGVSLDVIEMDAASNRGIEDIRELRERTRYASGESRYKVYIIDEAHMLTNEACNAFLKTLEEPPPGVIFILATTDPSRLPSTIVSRCQRFDFHLLTVVQIKQRLQQVVEEEGWPVEEEALFLIARLAEGSMRDALGLLEQCCAYGEELITAEHVRIVTGATRADIIESLVQAVADGNLEAAITILQQITFSGRDLSLFLRDLTFIFSRLILCGEAKGLRPEENYYGFESLLQQFVGSFNRKGLMDVIELLHQVSGELRHAHYPQFVLEIALIRILRVLDLTAAQEQSTASAVQMNHPSNLPPEPLPQERKAAPEAHMQAALLTKTGYDEAASTLPGRVSKQQEKPVGARAGNSSTSEPEGAYDNAGGGIAGSEDLEQFWPRLLSEVKKSQTSTHDYLSMAQSRTLQGGQLVLTYRKGLFAAERIGDKGHRQLVEKVFHELIARPVRLKVVVTDIEEDSSQLPKIAQPESVAEGIEPIDTVSGLTMKSGEETDYLFDEALKLFQGKIIDEQEKEDKS